MLQNWPKRLININVLVLWWFHISETHGVLLTYTSNHILFKATPLRTISMLVFRFSPSFLQHSLSSLKLYPLITRPQNQKQAWKWPNGICPRLNKVKKKKMKLKYNIQFLCCHTKVQRKVEPPTQSHLNILLWRFSSHPLA